MCFYETAFFSLDTPLLQTLTQEQVLGWYYNTATFSNLNTTHACTQRLFPSLTSILNFFKFLSPPCVHPLSLPAAQTFSLSLLQWTSAWNYCSLLLQNSLATSLFYCLLSYYALRPFSLNQRVCHFAKQRIFSFFLGNRSCVQLWFETTFVLLWFVLLFVIL